MMHERAMEILVNSEIPFRIKERFYFGIKQFTYSSLFLQFRRE